MSKKSDSETRQRQLKSTFGDLIPAAQLLDDWLVWMEDACGTVLGPGGTRCLPFLHRPVLLPAIGASFGEDGDDGALAETCTFLIDVVEPLKHEVIQWAPELVDGTQRIFRRQLLKFEPTSPRLIGLWSALSCNPVLAAPTAHEAAASWLKRFCDIAAQARTRCPTDDQITSIMEARQFWPLFFGDLIWNSKYAAELLAGMEQERRWLTAIHRQRLTADGRLADDYKQVWRPVTGPWLYTMQIINEISPLQSKILRILLNSTKPELKESLKNKALGARASVSSTFNLALGKLQKLRLIRAGGRGRASQGYVLTLPGKYAAQRLNG